MFSPYSTSWHMLCYTSEEGGKIAAYPWKVAIEFVFLRRAKVLLSLLILHQQSVSRYIYVYFSLSRGVCPTRSLYISIKLIWDKKYEPNNTTMKSTKHLFSSWSHKEFCSELLTFNGLGVAFWIFLLNGWMDAPHPKNHVNPNRATDYAIITIW